MKKYLEEKKKILKRKFPLENTEEETPAKKLKFNINDVDQKDEKKIQIKSNE